ncbi:glycosyltransferase [Aureivirga sp. CE67]|uniref:glycosyltransferase n=1 Tax=Aureivirga sp. CE67 TaxID=1788983 RepID=UPI0018CAFF29|nr:glycosyltransferase [Aureivirga sp. CE67]
MLEFLFITFIVIVIVQLFYYLFIFGRFTFSTPNQKKKSPNKPPVSVLVCAKNEAENLKKFLPSIAKQNYPEFEIVLINDASYDETLDIMEEFRDENAKDFEKKNISVKIVNVYENEQFWGTKKYALSLGIRAATHEHMLFTDADCEIISENWISEMLSNYHEEKSIVLGYGAYRRIRNSFLNKLIRFETVLTATQYFAYAKNRIPYMGVGRNLSYTEETFLNVNGFVNHMKIKSGDDDLFINEVANRNNTAICFTPESFTVSEPETSMKNWIRQKRRHVSTAKHYKWLHKILLALFYISQVGFWFLAIVLLSEQYKWEIVGSLILFRLSFHYLSLGCAAFKLKEKDLILLLPFLDFILIATQLYVAVRNYLSKPKYW